MSVMSNILPFTGDASILAHCLRSALKRGLLGADAEESAFRTACCRPMDRNRPEDVAHMEAAWKIVGGKEL